MGRIKILAVDDDVEFLEELKEMLELSGYEVDVFSDNEGILAKIDEYKPNILLLDLKMAPKSGFQIVDAIRHFSKWHHFSDWQNLIIIAMTGNFKDKEHQVMTRIYGIKSFLTKPIYPLDLIAQLEFCINDIKHLQERDLYKKNSPQKKNFQMFSDN